ncbi:MAG: hypothetical protein PHW76_05180, partial [Alphaproteobacteria bacterium]|nr:hypothetical protein [Alphaproteobacteria bacterium]
MTNKEYPQPIGAKCSATQVVVPVNGISLVGDLCIPGEAKGVVIFAQGSGSSRLSPRNTFVANALNQRNIAT